MGRSCGFVSQGHCKSCEGCSKELAQSEWTESSCRQSKGEGTKSCTMNFYIRWFSIEPLWFFGGAGWMTSGPFSDVSMVLGAQIWGAEIDLFNLDVNMQSNVLEALPPDFHVFSLYLQGAVLGLKGSNDPSHTVIWAKVNTFKADVSKVWGAQFWGIETDSLNQDTCNQMLCKPWTGFASFTETYSINLEEHIQSNVLNRICIFTESYIINLEEHMHSNVLHALNRSCICYFLFACKGQSSAQTWAIPFWNHHIMWSGRKIQDRSVFIATQKFSPVDCLFLTGKQVRNSAWNPWQSISVFFFSDNRMYPQCADGCWGVPDLLLLSLTSMAVQISFSSVIYSHCADNCPQCPENYCWRVPEEFLTFVFDP